MNPEFKEENYPNCVKEKQHNEEWSHTAQFFEWLSSKGLFLCKYETEEEARARGSVSKRTGEVWRREYPLPIGRNLLSLFHEYIGVDPYELEMERRRLLDLMREMNQRAQEGVRQNEET